MQIGYQNMAQTNKCEAPQCLSAFETSKKFFHTASAEFQAATLQQSMTERWKHLCARSVATADCGAIQAALALSPSPEELEFTPIIHNKRGV